MVFVDNIIFKINSILKNIFTNKLSNNWGYLNFIQPKSDEEKCFSWETKQKATSNTC